MAPRAVIERAQEELLAGHLDDRRLARVRPIVRESWERSFRGNVAAEGEARLDFETVAQLDAARQARPFVLVMDMVRALLLKGAPEESGILLSVGDEAGRMLWVEGDREVINKGERLGFVAGTNWSESTVGTTAPGTALALGRAVQIRGAEHYNRFVHPWACTASPVHDPETRRILGVINVTGGENAASPQAGMIIDATVRAIQAEMLVARLRARESTSCCPTAGRNGGVARRIMLRILGRDKAKLEVMMDHQEEVIDLSPRHSAILLMLATHPQGLSAERLAELVYGPQARPGTLRPEIVRLRKILERHSSDLIPESRPYRLTAQVDTDVARVVSFLDRGAHRAAFSEYRGPVLPGAVSPGVEELREDVRAAFRESMLADAPPDVLLDYAETEDGREDVDVLGTALRALPWDSPRRARLIVRLEYAQAS